MGMSKIVNIEDTMWHKVSELICLKCLYRYIGVRPGELLLKSIECPKCGKTGGTIETGEDPESSNDGKVVEFTRKKV
jgi:predicted nucleic-acid-binding Zn-ribbon protein